MNQQYQNQVPESHEREQFNQWNLTKGPYYNHNPDTHDKYIDSNMHQQNLSKDEFNDRRHILKDPSEIKNEEKGIERIAKESPGLVCDTWRQECRDRVCSHPKEYM
jgi:hypothetical protein